MSSILKYSPAVFAVGKDYQIFVPVTESSVLWVRVGGDNYYDHSNGILRSASNMHKVTVPASKLDAEKKYTVCYRKMIERKPYFSVTGDIEEVDFSFSPLPDGKFNLYQVADAHGMINQPVASAKVFEEKYGKIDLLLLNGDVIDHSGNIENFDAIYAISSLITGGRIPVVFSRGNHDTRGIYAEEFENYTPTRYGKSYFTFRISDLWGIVLDCGEDKLDCHEEYGNANCHEAFRREETAYLESVIVNAKNEYEEEGVTKKLVFAHVPFTTRFRPPFNIEEDIYAKWTKFLREEIKPDLMVTGHLHKYFIIAPGSEQDAWGQPCSVVVGSAPDTKARTFAGAGVAFGESDTTVVFCNENEITLEEKV